MSLPPPGYNSGAGRFFSKGFGRPRNNPAAVTNLLIMRRESNPAAFFDEFHPRVFRFIAAATGAPRAMSTISSRKPCSMPGGVGPNIEERPRS